jgi:hypothetical protein
MSVLSPFETLLVVILAIFYVDDGMPGVNDWGEDVATPLPILLHQAEDATQARERLLFASGGALELSKCFAYILYWDFSGGHHRLIPPHEIKNCVAEDKHFRGPIGLAYGTNNARNLLVTEDPWMGRRTLGALRLLVTGQTNTSTIGRNPGNLRYKLPGRAWHGTRQELGTS